MFSKPRYDLMALFALAGFVIGRVANFIVMKLTLAPLDRLAHHAHSPVIRGESYRQRSRRKEATGAPSISP